MKLVLRIFVAAFALALTGCAGTTSVANRELRSESITQMTRAIVVTNLNRYMDADLFSAFSSKLQNALQQNGVLVNVILLPPLESIDQPNIESEVLKFKAKHVITLYKGNGLVRENGSYIQMDIIANAIDVVSSKKVWGARFTNSMGGTLRPADDRAAVIANAILAELRAAGLLVGPVG
ncbi:MAG: hypothetical protein JWM03_891 [Rhodocyclales bacterium]|nr:hypothetical protein [Rhodocyclales bacterium]MDB5888019.1 hypothetical protein [Rhodocyclales bacterium]